ncbi:uncharacterized protein PG986_003753 [Apiospora aurea]|uniref:Transmembrane protein n=1 Tax=Apiospora aurea TaxID=335848 RepID=A0ABR1QSL0_9PEZI
MRGVVLLKIKPYLNGLNRPRMGFPQTLPAPGVLEVLSPKAIFHIVIAQQRDAVETSRRKVRWERRIIVSFIITAWLVVGLLIDYYALYHDPCLRREGGRGDRNPGEYRANPLDVCLYRARDVIFHTMESALVNSAKVAGHTKIMEKLSRGDYRPGPATEAGLVKIMTALSDLQLFTGPSLLICFSIAQDGMLGYHWKTITRLSWFSTITHLAALSIWHRQPHNLTFKQVLRLILMTCLAIMLLAALMVTADSGFRDDYYAVCYMRVPRPRFNIANPDVIFSRILLSSNFVIQCSRPYSLTATSPFQSAKNRRLSLKAALFVFYGHLAAARGVHDISGNGHVYHYVHCFRACEWGTLRLLELRTKGPPGENDCNPTCFKEPEGASSKTIKPVFQLAGTTVHGPSEHPSNAPTPLRGKAFAVIDQRARTFDTEATRWQRIHDCRYKSRSCFGDLVWQLCLWILFATFFLVLVNLEQFAPIVKLLPDIPLFPTEQDPLENILVDNQYDQSPFYAFVVLLGWLLLFQPVSSVLSIFFLSSRWLQRRSRSRWGVVVRVLAVVCSSATPTLTDLYCNLIQAAWVYAGVVAVYIALCVGSTFSLVGSHELEGWKRLSAEVELASAAAP